jgi:hypothetical protein
MKPMDTDQMNCAKCGHLLKDGAEACAYCGTAVASPDSPPQADGEPPDLAEQAAEQPEVSTDDASVAAATEASSVPPDVTSKAKPSDQVQPEETRRLIDESAAEVTSGTVDSLPEADDQFDFQLPDDELIVDFDADETAKEPAQPAAADTGSVETEKPGTESAMDDIVDLKQHAAEATAEVISLSEKASGKTVSEDNPGLPQTPVLEVSAEDPSESETLGADILDLVKDETIEPETAPDQASGLTPHANGTATEELDAILLTSDEAVQSGTPSSPTDTAQTAKSTEAEEPVEPAAPTAAGTAKADPSSPSDDARSTADANRKHADAQASLEAAKIEKAARAKKAALAKALALKKKKLKLAKAQALKKKKLKLAQAQALKKQKEARAGIENSDKASAAGPDMVQSMEANTQLLGLLKKYEGQTIGINYDNSADIKAAELVATNAEFFSVFVKDQELTYCHPLKTVLTVIEGKDGVESGNPEQTPKFNAVVKVYPLVLF